jgi:iron complex outermembrane recepter protein
VSTGRISDCLRACSIYLFLSMNGLAQNGALAELPSSAGAGLEEIVVTATKREENLNRVRETVTVVTAETLRDQHISTPADVADLVLGLTYANTQFNTPVYTLRGVGYFENSLAAYPAVTVYADEMPFQFSVLAKHAVYDLDQIEVLKGPQGTVFGQNSTGGAINYIQAKPTMKFDAGASLTYGRFNEVQTESFVSGPLTNNLQARLTVRDEVARGWQH